MKKTKPHSEVASQAILSIAKSFSFNSQKYIPNDGASLSLFKVEILSGLTVALALVPEAIASGTNASATVNPDKISTLNKEKDTPPFGM